MSAEPRYDQRLVRKVVMPYLASLVIVMSYLIYVFWQRRTLQPIAARVPEIVVLSNVFLLMLSIMICFSASFLEDYPCLLVHFHSSLFICAVATLYLLRCWILIFNFELTISLITQQQQTRRNSSFSRVKNPDFFQRASFLSKGSWFMTNRHLMDPSNLFKSGCLVFCLLVTPAVIVAIAAPPATATTHDGLCDWDAGNWTVTGTVIFFVIIFALMSLKLREVIDGFYIKLELMVTAFIVFVGAVTWAVLAFNTKWTEGLFPFHMLVYLFTILLTFIISICLPVYDSFKADAGGVLNDTDHFGPQEGASHEFATLHGIIAHPPARHAFKGHLIKEFALENIVFYQEVEGFRKLATKSSDMEAIFKEGLRLYERYIMRGSTFELNIGFVHRQELDRTFGAHVAEQSQSRSRSLFSTRFGRRISKEDKAKQNATELSLIKQDVAVEVVADPVSRSKQQQQQQQQQQQKTDNPNDVGKEHKSKKKENSSSNNDHDEEEEDDEHTDAPVQQPNRRDSESYQDGKTQYIPLDPSIFDNAQLVVFTLMERDSFPRFKRTEEYKTLVSTRSKSLHRALSHQGSYMYSNNNSPNKV